MVCLSCAERIGWPVCDGCRLELVDGPERRVSSGLLVVAALRHEGAARRLVHRIKYQAVSGAADVLADRMVPRLPAGAAALIPVPRALARRIGYGIDPAVVLAERLGRRTGLPVLAALVPAVWWPRHAMRAPGERRRPRFRVRRPVPPGAVLVDDVVTSGATMTAAAEALNGDLRHGIAATSPGRVSIGGSQGVSISREDVWRSDHTHN